MRQISFLIAFFLISYTINAQFYAKVGIKAGGNFNTLSGDGAGNSSPTFGFHMGGLIEMMINRRGNIFFQPELMYSLQGVNYDLDEDEFISSEKIRLHYLSVPLIAKIYLNGYSDEWFLEAGPNINFLLSAKKIEKGTFNGTSITNEIDFSESYSATDLGFNIGFGHKFFDRTAFISVRYNLGLTNINEYEDLDIKNNNSVIQLSAGLIFN